ncbi:hypothetical protein ACFVT5_06965 [Streptomyces sp. NPDC058001]|uniref:hypothetical protein n=1 Tax=Streptomyces sp. NPDC058001 TaxID=3346300 RepID=UPI0036EB1B88
MAESPGDHNTVVGLLAAFIRENTALDTRRIPESSPPEQGMREPVPAWGTEPPADIRAAMDVLARRPDRAEPRRVDLRSTTLVGLIVRRIDFDAPPRLSRMYFTWADLRLPPELADDPWVMARPEDCLAWRDRHAPHERVPPPPPTLRREP